MVQPAIKCRGPEYLRIIYGPEYLLPENLERLRAPGVGAKRSLASREFELGIETMERFVRKEPRRRTHECVFGGLALEIEPLDHFGSAVPKRLMAVTEFGARVRKVNAGRGVLC